MYRDEIYATFVHPDASFTELNNYCNFPHIT